jgi:hypothetical protein
MLKFLKVSKVVLTFLKTYFQFILQNLLIGHIVRKYIESRSKKLIWKFHSYVAFWKGLGMI